MSRTRVAILAFWHYWELVLLQRSEDDMDEAPARLQDLLAPLVRSDF